MRPLRTAIIGCGRIAKRHADILATLDDISLVGFCDQDRQAAAGFVDRYGCGEVFTDWDIMFNRLHLGLVYICLPPFAHDKEVECACEHGVHFLIEKPVGLSIDQALKAARAVGVSGVKSQVGFMHRFGEAAIWLKHRWGKEAPGSALMMGRYACNSLHQWWWRDRALSGGQLIEQAIHLLDMSRFLLGEPVQVYSMQDNLFHAQVGEYTAEDASATLIRFAAGGIAVVTATNGAIPKRWDCDWRVVLQDLTADFSDANHAAIQHTDHDWSSTTSIAAEKDLFLAETLDLLEAIRVDRSPTIPYAEGVRSLQLALSAARSAGLGQAVDIEDPFEPTSHSS
jgi:predicted dehydrogenase